MKEEDKLNTFVGTKEYVSPEVLKGRSCSPAADMWSLGVIIYQLYTGTTPFFDPNSEYFTFQSIMECKYEIPESVPSDVKDLIQHLLIFDPKERLRATQVKNHKFFEGYNFNETPKEYSPLCTLYNRIKEHEEPLDASEEDSFMIDDNFDEDFVGSVEMANNSVCPLRQPANNEITSKGMINYLKKSSSLGEREMKELNKTEQEKEGYQQDETVEKNNLRLKTSAKTHKSLASKDDSSQDNTYDSGLEPNTPTLRDQSPEFEDTSDNQDKKPSKLIVLEGHIKKITAWIIYKRRFMELSYTDDVPRLVYYTANKKTLRNEIALNHHTKIYSTGPSKFEISDLGHTYYFKDCGGEAKIKTWVSALNKAISSISHRKPSFKGNKALSATFC